MQVPIDKSIPIVCVEHGDRQHQNNASATTGVVTVFQSVVVPTRSVLCCGAFRQRSQ